MPAAPSLAMIRARNWVFPHSEHRRAIAQLVARFVRDEEVVSSSLTSPTRQKTAIRRFFGGSSYARETRTGSGMRVYSHDMTAPLYSTVTLFAELGVSAIIYTALYRGYKHNAFPRAWVAIAVSYEILFNISYMIYRTTTHTQATAEPVFNLIFAAIHGSLSLLMFIALLIFFFVAWKNYAKGVNFFKKHTPLTITFAVLWALSIGSGIFFYLLEYAS